MSFYRSPVLPCPFSSSPSLDQQIPLQKGLRIVHLYWPVFVTSPDLFKKNLLLQIKSCFFRIFSYNVDD